jgi:transcriptional regulator with XRE-family HTH domain
MNKTFGQLIAAARKAALISQKDLAAAIRKEDGVAISPQYLNDIEHDRRNPPSEFIITQIARELKLSADHLIAAAGIMPSDVQKDLTSGDPDRVDQAFRAFRRELKK